MPKWTPVHGWPNDDDIAWAERQREAMKNREPSDGQTERIYPRSDPTLPIPIVTEEEIIARSEGFSYWGCHWSVSVGHFDLDTLNAWLYHQRVWRPRP